MLPSTHAIPVQGSATGHRSATPLGPLVAVAPASRRFLLALEPIPEDWVSPYQPADVIGTMAQVASAGIRSPPHAWQLTAYAGVRCPARA